MSMLPFIYLFLSCRNSDPKTESAPSNESPISDPDQTPDEDTQDSDQLDTGAPDDTDTATPEPTDPADIEGWELVWRDEFEATEIDPTLWGFEVNGYGGGNNELQYYTDRSKNARLEDGNLVIEAHREEFTGPDGTRSYTSARLRTANRGDWKYGRIEARMRLPKGQGIWPAFWMLPTDYVYGGWPASGEIDIMELVGHEANVVHGTLHYGGIYPHHTYTGEGYTIDEDFSEDFHTFAVEWEEGEIRWYVDGVHTQTQTNWYTTEGAFPAPFDQRFHVLLNVAVGGTWPGNPDSSTVFPQQMVVDYVRVYQRPDSDEPDPEPTDPSNLLTNSGFESITNNGTFNVPSNWLVYPSNLTNYLAEESGNPIFGSAETFLSLNGNRSLKVYGQFTGSENNTTVYQEFPASAGEQYSFSVHAFTHLDDKIAGNNRAVVSLGFFDGSFNFVGVNYAASFAENATPNTWTELIATGTAPVGTQYVQGRIEFLQCEGQSSGTCFDGGSVYFDDAEMRKTTKGK